MSRPIQLIVGFSPGGSTDILARLIGQRLSETMGQPVIIQNRPGAGGSIAAAAVAKSPADGYTLFLASTSHTINATYYQNLSYDTAASFSAVAPIAVVPFTLVVHPGLGTKTLKNVIDLAKASPGALNFGSAGNGTASHLAGEVFKNMAKVAILHVPYKGPAEQLQEVLAGRIQMAIVPVNAARPFVDSGKLTAVGMTTAKRSWTAAGRCSRCRAPHGRQRAAEVRDKRRTRSPHDGQDSGLHDWLRRFACIPIGSASACARTAARGFASGRMDGSRLRPIH